jgi:glycosyltransferase involved in cell wall biosynthesis
MDGFPISFLETAACKRPMVSNILPAYAGMVPEGSFWMVPPNSIPDLAKAFKEALNADPPEIVQRTEKAYAHAKKIGEWNRWVQSTEELYKLVIQQWLHSNF